MGANRMGFGAQSALPAWLPLSVLTWITMMAVYHGFGIAFEYCDRTGLLGKAKVRRADRLGYFDLLPRVIVNHVCVLLPCMVALQWAGLAYVGAPRLGPLRFVFNLASM